MAKTKVDEWSTTAASNTDIGGINIQGTAPVSNIDDAFQSLMAQIAATPLAESASDMRDALSVLSRAETTPIFDTAALTGEDFSTRPYRAIGVRGNGGDLTWYAYDSEDTTTADDGGLTTIVVSGRRYKRAAQTVLKTAALSATTVAQPASPALGDCYILTAAPTGTDWASKAENIATWTASGWVFQAPSAGMVAYVADSATFYHYSASGAWTAGLGPVSLDDGSIGPKKLAHPFAILKCEDSRDAPPGTAPTAGTCYQVGTSPTGDFAGHTDEIARYTGSAYEFIAPEEGDTIYRKDATALYTYISGVWGSAYAQSSHRQALLEAETESALSTLAVGASKTVLTRSITGAAGQMVRVTLPKIEIKEVHGTLSTFTYEFELYVDTESTPRLTSQVVTMVSSTSGTYYGATGPVILSASIGDAVAHTYTVKVKKLSQTVTGTNNRTKVTDVHWEVLNLS